jgi:hypothetical protein
VLAFLSLLLFKEENSACTAPPFLTIFAKSYCINASILVAIVTEEAVATCCITRAGRMFTINAFRFRTKINATAITRTLLLDTIPTTNFLTFRALLTVSDAFVAFVFFTFLTITIFHFCTIYTEPSLAFCAVIKHLVIVLIFTHFTVERQAFIARVVLISTTRKVNPAAIPTPTLKR